VLDGDPALPPQKGGGAPKFSAHVYCGQTAGCIKIILGTKVGLGPGNLVVLDGDPAPPQKGPGDFVFDRDPATPRTEGTPTATQFLAHVYCGQTAGWMKTPLGTEVDLGPGHIILDGVQPLRETGTEPPPSFRPMSNVATVAYLSYC